MLNTEAIHTLLKGIYDEPLSYSEFMTIGKFYSNCTPACSNNVIIHNECSCKHCDFNVSCTLNPTCVFPRDRLAEHDVSFLM